jgi:L-cysteine/cystine lyase
VADEGWLEAVRGELPVCADGAPVYMNIGGAGPLPAAAAAAIIRAVERGRDEGRGSLEAVRRMEETADRLRASAAALVGGRSREIALTGNTTVGVNVALWGLRWSAGDEIITTALEHPGVSVPVGVLARRFRVRVHHIPGDEAEGDLEGAVGRRAGRRTRAVVLSHVAYGTGSVLDVAGAARSAEHHGALCVVDGAQSVGAIPVDGPATGAHAYAFPAHKWLYGPEGLGALWVRRDATARIDLSFSGYESGAGHTTDGGLLPHAGARRYETSTPPMALLEGWAAAIAWLEGIGWDRIAGRIRAGRAAAAEALGALPGVAVHAPARGGAGLVTFTVAGADPPAAAAALADAGVVVRFLDHPRALRASIGFHWCTRDVDRLVRAVAALDGC